MVLSKMIRMSLSAVCLPVQQWQRHVGARSFVAHAPPLPQPAYKASAYVLSLQTNTITYGDWCLARQPSMHIRRLGAAFSPESGKDKLPHEASSAAASYAGAGADSTTARREHSRGSLGACSHALNPCNLKLQSTWQTCRL